MSISKDRILSKGFTVIELMVSIFVAVIALGTFFKLYTNAIKNERSTNLRTSVAHVGDQIAESLSAPLRLIGLNNDFSDYSTGDVILDTNGGSGTDAVSFRFRSPYGGPITKLKEAATGTAPSCDFTLLGTGAFYTGISKIQLLSVDGIYSVTGFTFDPSLNTVNGGSLVDSDGVPYGGDCTVDFPEGTLVTGGNNEYLFTYINGGANTIVRLSNITTGENIVDFDNDADSPFSVPYFVLQFMREYDSGGGILAREWLSDIDEVANPTVVQQIKAIRFGFVMLSTKERTRKKDSGAGLATTVNYCPFENMCYSHNDLNKTAYVFRRVVHVKNFDYLQRNSDITY